ncbi:MAG: hypothetical protein V3V64_10970, partial [Acidiferrobacterales bacterium]
AGASVDLGQAVPHVERPTEKPKFCSNLHLVQEGANVFQSFAWLKDGQKHKPLSEIKAPCMSAPGPIGKNTYPR